MEKVKYNTINKEFNEIRKLAENVYNITVVVDYFCSNQPYVDDRSLYLL